MSDDGSMQRTRLASKPEATHDVEDYVADYCHDAVDAGIHPAEVIVALQRVEEEIEERRVEDA